jgi:quercetin dioxygenase-like cupin family protein
MTEATLSEATLSNAAAPEPKPGRMEIFSGGGEPLTAEMMPFEGIDDSVMAGFAKMMESGARAGDGESVRCLYRESQGRFSVCYAWFKSGFIVPRHSHNADCVYYVLGGELKMGARVLKKGDGIFVPSDHGYTFEAGPAGAEVLEFRNSTNFHIKFKGNDDAHWERMAKAYRDNAAVWPTETVPPSDRKAMT